MDALATSKSTKRLYASVRGPDGKTRNLGRVDNKRWAVERFVVIGEWKPQRPCPRCGRVMTEGHHERFHPGRRG